MHPALLNAAETAGVALQGDEQAESFGWSARGILLQDNSPVILHLLALAGSSSQIQSVVGSNIKYLVGEQHANINPLIAIVPIPPTLVVLVWGAEYLQKLNNGGELLSDRMERLLCEKKKREGEEENGGGGGLMSEKETVEICDQILEGVIYLHSLGICHGDIKPSNIFLSSDSQVLLLNCGTGGLPLSSSSSSSPSSLLSSIEHFSPELVKGDPLDELCDLWSIAVILYTLLSGIKPFQAPSLPSLLQTIGKGLYPALSHNLSISDSLRTVVDRALSKDYSKRFMGACSFQSALKPTTENGGGGGGGVGGFSTSSLDDFKRNSNRVEDLLDPSATSSSFADAFSDAFSTSSSSRQPYDGFSEPSSARSGGGGAGGGGGGASKPKKRWKRVFVPKDLFAVGGAKGRFVVDAQASVEAFCIGLRTWETAVTPMRTPRMGLACARIGSTIVAGGGIVRGKSRDGEDSATIECLDIGTGLWLEGPSMRTSRSEFSFIERNGRLLAIGGFERSRGVSRVEFWDPRTRGWGMVNAMRHGRGGAAVAAAGTNVFVMGGCESKTMSPGATIEIFDDVAGKWFMFPPMPRATTGHVAAEHNGMLYVMGGSDSTGAVSSQVDVLDHTLGDWFTGPPLVVPRTKAGVCVAMDKLFVLGGLTTEGRSHKPLATVEVLSHRTNGWEMTTPMHTPRAGLGIAVAS